MADIKSIGSLVFLPFEYAYDFFRACRWSKASPMAPQSTSAYYDAILLAHTIEKGLSQPAPRPGFGKLKISSLLDLCDLYKSDWDQFPVEKTYGALLAYVEWHATHAKEIGELEPRILSFISACKAKGMEPRGGTKSLSQEVLACAADQTGTGLLMNRYSCRKYRDAVVPREMVEQVVSIAQRAPSQCNRQSSRVHCYQNPADIKQLLTLQRGAAGFADGVKNLFVVTSEMTAWSGCNARNQSFVDGALFAMQLSLACSSMGLGSCALNLAVGNLREKRIREAGHIPHAERLILMMAFGYPDNDGALTVAKSERVSLGTAVKIH